MKIFVTGGTGFVGSHLVDALRAAEHDVCILVRDVTKAERLFIHADPPSAAAADIPLRMAQGDLNDLNAIRSGCEGAEVVFHLAGLTAARNKEEFLAINGHATRTLATVVAQAAPDLQRFVFVSSLAAAGPTRIGMPLTEQSTARPVSDYGWSKLAGEEAVKSSELPWTIVRPPTVYGPRDREVFKVFKLARWGFAVFFGDGSQELSFIYAPDLAEWLVRLASADTEHGAYFASHDEIRTSKELSFAVHQAIHPHASKRPLAIGVPPGVARGVLWMIGTGAAALRRRTLLNANKANEFLADAWTCRSEALQRATDWRPPTDLTTGLQLTAAWYRERGWL